MSDYSNIKDDCEKVSEGIARVVTALERQTNIWREEPESENYDPDWLVCFPPEQVKYISELLVGASGLLRHLGLEPMAATTLFNQHVQAEKAKL